MSGDNTSDEDNMPTIQQHVLADSGSVIRNVVQSRGNKILDLDDRLDIKFPKRKSTYYSVTESEIEMYAQLGWLSSLLLTLFGTSSGFTLGCVAAMVQGNLPSNSQSVFLWLAWVTGVISVIFLAIAIYLIMQQSKSKKAWETIE